RISDKNLIRRLPHAQASRVEPHPHIRVAIKLAIVERRLDDVLHRVTGGDAGNKLAHQQPRQRSISVGEVIDVGLLPCGITGVWQGEALKAGIAEIANIGRRHAVTADAEEAERTALETVGSFLAQPADTDQIVAVAGRLQNTALLIDASADQ